MRSQQLPIFEAIPLTPNLCVWCVDQNLPNPQWGTMETLLAFNGPHVIVNVCARCYLTLRGMGVVAALGRPATLDEIRKFYAHNGLQVSGSTEEPKPAEEPREALAKAIEPPTPRRALPSPREGLWDEKKATPADEWDGKWICLTSPCQDRVKRSWNSLNDHRKRRHPDIPTIGALDLYPKHKYRCESASHREWGCKQTFRTEEERTAHHTGRGPDRKIIDAWKERYGAPVRT